MQYKLYYILGVAIFFTSNYSQAEELDNIAKFVTEVCDEIIPKGKRNVTKTDVEAGVKGNIGKIAKYLGVDVGLDGKLVLNKTNEEYEGLPYEDLSEQMTDSRSCKRALSKQLIEERKKVKNRVKKLFSDDLSFVKWPNTSSKFIVETTTVNPSCSEDAESKKSIIKINIKGQDVSLNVNGINFDAKLSSDKKVIMANGTVRDDEGFTTFSNGTIKLRSDGEIEGELPWIWKDDNGYVCSGMDAITDVKKQLSNRL